MKRWKTLVFGKVRRFYESTFQHGEVVRQIAMREGDCNRCGACCKLLFRCPFLIEKEGVSSCAIYSIRPMQCRYFPIAPADIKEIEGECTFLFPNLKKNPDIEVSPITEPLYRKDQS